MRTSRIVLAAGVLCLVTGTVGFADHHETGQASEGGMPPIGPPAEMKQLEGMNGEYTVKFMYKMDPMSEEWLETDATAVLSTVAGGAAQQMLFEGEMMACFFRGWASRHTTARPRSGSPPGSTVWEPGSRCTPETSRTERWL